MHSIEGQKDVLAQEEVIHILLVLGLYVSQQIGRIGSRRLDKDVFGTSLAEMLDQILVESGSVLMADQIDHVLVRVL